MSDMAYRQLGSSGLNVSVVGIGCNNFGFRIDEEASAAVVSARSRSRRQPVRHRGELRRE